MSILISACLLGIRCRFDGGHCRSRGVIRLADSEQFIPVCPEQLGGLPTPRPPADITSGDGNDVLDGSSRVLTHEGSDVTGQFLAGAQEVLKIARRLGVTRALLKQRSPSCGCGQICRKGEIVSGDGVTAALLKRNGIPVTAR